ncbi:MAG: serine/threonine protein kinase [Polyangiaceae bacterium]|nr:serine/threonine protein kinase [Polyangiaceae bacterium]
MNAEAMASEELVAGKYHLTRLIGRGGMGSVWEGIHVSLGTRVAVKFIDSEYINSEEIRARFANEARAAAKLVSKHVVQVFDHGACADGRSYIVMEFLSGEALDHRLDRVGRLSPAETARIVTQVCRGLSKAHAAGIVHRDLKPENIFLVWDEEDGADIAKVVDFGIAKFTDSSIAASSATRTGSVLGTPFYMSPEQARGLRTVDRRTDLWALGVVTYRCLVGALPFEGEALGDLLVKICTAPLPIPSQQLPGLSPTFDAWFARALDRDANQRFGSATEFAETLCMALGVAATGGRQAATGYAVSGELGATAPANTPAPWSPGTAGPARSGVYPGGSRPGTPAPGQDTQAAPGMPGAGAASYPLDLPTADISSLLLPQRRRVAPVVVALLAALVVLIAVGVGYAVLGGDKAPAAAQTAQTASVQTPVAPPPLVQPSVVPANEPSSASSTPEPTPEAAAEDTPPEPPTPAARIPHARRATRPRAAATQRKEPKTAEPAQPAAPPAPVVRPPPRPRGEVDLGY